MVPWLVFYFILLKREMLSVTIHQILFYPHGKDLMTHSVFPNEQVLLPCFTLKSYILKGAFCPIFQIQSGLGGMDPL